MAQGRLLCQKKKRRKTRKTKKKTTTSMMMTTKATTRAKTPKPTRPNFLFLIFNVLFLCVLHCDSASLYARQKLPPPIRRCAAALNPISIK